MTKTDWFVWLGILAVVGGVFLLLFQQAQPDERIVTRTDTIRDTIADPVRVYRTPGLSEVHQSIESARVVFPEQYHDSYHRALDRIERSVKEVTNE